ncbi:dTDP-4-amino-4,6-dideoxygalactose transaminase [Salinibacter ruber]|uniref:dTDP-4-amino-4,6-dideoxygalactose transaminase n=1 Tax=Salinibacter ruber TaxID=146919 RepID=UPI0021681EAA|nr:dTDP-4-amino-4,6-dideoxygalactose transaminase [Salinibacter ruber]MCS3855305.1 dTDP-4-amino-4,6-dideoxygalactose transaminase [Salinibacter ruber]
MDIPFNKPYIGDEEREAVAEAVEQDILRGDGPTTNRVQSFLEDWLDVRHALLTTSCTHALEMAIMALDIGPGDEVIMPSFNFVSSANAVVLQGATPVFAEIRPETMNLDPAAVEKKITTDTEAIVLVHYGGVACDMEAFLDLGERYDVAIVEDAAQGVDAYFNDEPLGTIGDIGCYSFHDTKNITSGEGGAFLTNDEEIAARAEIIREKGTNRSAFYRGEVDKYSWVDEGSSYIPSDILAALLEVQLERRDEIRRKRKQVWSAYRDAVRPFVDDGLIEWQTVPEYADPNFHLFYFRTDTPEERDELLDALKAEGIQATFHYVPLHSSPYGRNILNCTETLPTTQHCSETLIRLPVYPQLSTRIDKVSEVIIEKMRNKLSSTTQSI